MKKTYKQLEFNFDYKEDLLSEVTDDPKDMGVDGYEYHDEILRDYKVVEADHEDF
jgi:hypothetical protein